MVGLSPCWSFGANATGIEFARYQKRFFEASVGFIQRKSGTSPAKALKMAIYIHAQQDLVLADEKGREEIQLRCISIDSKPTPAA
jgi:hypothetical protein